ncbi:MAG: hypothetical protein KDD83_11015, partial [Caldilineaceae bacterium]|nr:hypothetical protein [Caldilineaceae bacterium]
GEDEETLAAQPAAPADAGKPTGAKPVPSKAALAQAAVDERIADMLNLLNVPTRRDVRQLQEQLAALSRRLDELLDAQDTTQDAPDPSEPPTDG